MCLAQAPGPDRLKVLLQPGVGARRVVRVDGEVGPVSGKLNDGMLPQRHRLQTNGASEDGGGRARLEVDAAATAVLVQLRVLRDMVAVADALCVQIGQGAADMLGRAVLAGVNGAVNGQAAGLVEQGHHSRVVGLVLLQPPGNRSLVPSQV